MFKVSSKTSKTTSNKTVIKRSTPRKNYLSEKNENNAKTSSENDFQKIITTIKTTDQENVLSEIDSFIQVHSMNTLKALHDMTGMEHHLSLSGTKWTVLFYCIENNLNLVAQKIIECGVEVNSTFCSLNNPHPVTPLNIACKQNNIELVDILLKYGAKPDTNAFIKACSHNGKEILNKLTAYEHYQAHIDVKLVKQALIRSFWKYPENAKYYGKILEALGPSQEVAALNYEDLNSTNTKEVYHRLFKSPVKTANSQLSAFKIAIAQFNALLSSPAKCNIYLSFINEELTRYYQEKNEQDIPKLDHQSYQFEQIGVNLYPIPSEEYLGIKKLKALNEYVLTLLQKYELGEKQYKLIGFTPHDVADEIFGNGDFILEHKYGFVIFHNEISHMLQHALLILAIENGYIDIQYLDKNNQEHKLSVREIISLTLSKNLWIATRDHHNKQNLDFADPFSISTYIMYHHDLFGFLSDCMIDSFCKGLKRLYQAHSELVLDSHCPLSFNEYVTMFKEQRLEMDSTPSFLITYSMQREKEKKRHFVYGDDVNYAVVERHFSPLKEFEVRTKLSNGKIHI